MNASVVPSDDALASDRRFKQAVATSDSNSHSPHWCSTTSSPPLSPPHNVFHQPRTPRFGARTSEQSKLARPCLLSFSFLPSSFPSSFLLLNPLRPSGSLLSRPRGSYTSSSSSLSLQLTLDLGRARRCSFDPPHGLTRRSESHSSSSFVLYVYSRRHRALRRR